MANGKDVNIYREWWWILWLPFLLLSVVAGCNVGRKYYLVDEKPNTATVFI